MSKKGIEGLPLKYLVIALIGSVVIGLALQMTSLIQSNVMKSADIFSNSITGKVTDIALGDKYTLGFDRISIFKWIVNSSNSVGEIGISVINPESSSVNITSISSSLGGETSIKDFPNGLLLHSGESSSMLYFNVPSSVPLSKGDSVSVSVSIAFSNGSVDEGSLVSIVQ